MRTIIINTLGARFRPSDVFFRAFRDSELVWLTADFVSIAECAEMIDRLRSRENKAQDYHLVVLADLSGYELSSYEQSRKVIEKILAAYVMHKLLPLLEQNRDLPLSVSMIGLCTAVIEGKSGTRDLLKLLQFHEDQPDVMYIRGSKGMQDLQVQELFEAPLRRFVAAEEAVSQIREDPAVNDDMISYGKAIPQAQLNAEKEIESARRENLAQEIAAQITALQSYRPKTDEERNIEIKTGTFLVAEYERIEQVYADLQINLADFVQKIKQNKGVESVQDVLSPHSVQELAQLLENAKRKVDTYLEDRQGPGYYPLEVCKDHMDIESLRGKIQDALRHKAQDILGVKEYFDTVSQSGNPVEQAQQQLSSAWIRYDREKARFRNLYEKLQRQYDPAIAREEDQKIIQACAEAFSEWREDVCGSRMQKKKAVPGERPELPPAVQSQAEAEVQRSLLNGELKKLEGYEDVREQAEEIRREFERTSRLWEPEERFNAVSLFRRMTLVFAVIAVAVLLLPYMVMTWGVNGFFVPETSSIVISAVIFAGLYFCAVILWLWKVCSDMHACTEDLEALTEQSRVQRQQSISELVELYAKLMPQCMKDAMEREALEQIDRCNEEREIQWTLHRTYLKDARNELDDLCTALQLPHTQPQQSEEKVPQIRYDLAPFAPENQPCYLLFNGKEGNE